MPTDLILSILCLVAYGAIGTGVGVLLTLDDKWNVDEITAFMAGCLWPFFGVWLLLYIRLVKRSEEIAKLKAEAEREAARRKRQEDEMLKGEGLKL